MVGLDGKRLETESNVLLASIENMQYAVTLDVLHMVLWIMACHPFFLIIDWQYSLVNNIIPFNFFYRFSLLLALSKKLQCSIRMVVCRLWFNFQVRFFEKLYLLLFFVLSKLWLRYFKWDWSEIGNHTRRILESAMSGCVTWKPKDSFFNFLCP